jgi:hypothetical protein
MYEVQKFFENISKIAQRKPHEVNKLLQICLGYVDWGALQKI